MDSTIQFAVVKRLGRSPQERGASCGLRKTCPDIFALSSGDYAIIGRDITADVISKLPADAGCGTDERVVLIPREVLMAARKDIPEK
jgi:hypothetical protein